MSIELAIDDGDPWYISHDIWTVPGADPNGPPGIPSINQQSFVWARVHNKGTRAVFDAKVNYYWANPSTLITTDTATLLGTSNVSLEPGGVKEVLCLVPWRPNWTTSGHGCIIVEAFSPEDPVKHGAHAPFDPPNDRHVAQLNLNISTIYLGQEKSFAIFPFAIGNSPWLQTDELLIRASQSPVKRIEKLNSVGRKNNHLNDIGHDMTEFGLQMFQNGDQIKNIGSSKLEIKLIPNDQKTMALVVRAPLQTKGASCALFLIEQVVGNRIVGGIAALALFGIDKKRSFDGERRQ